MTIPAGTTWASRRDAILSLPEWQLEGRIALAAGKDGWSGNFTWKQTDDDLDFRFNGPMGLGGFRIYGDDESLRVKTSDGQDFVLTDPENDLRQRYGWAIPLHSLRYWMLGVPDPHEEADETVNDAQELVALTQRGWVIDYAGYDDRDGVLLPHKLNLEGEGVRLKVVVERWQVGE